MNKLNLIQNEINFIKNQTKVKCLFTDGLIEKEDDFKINLYLLLEKDDYKDSCKLINRIFMEYDELLLNTEKNNTFSYYYENKYNINVYYLFDYEVKLYDSIVSINDPFGLIHNFKVNSLAFTNNEYTKLINKLIFDLYKFYNLYCQNDSLYAYKKSLDLMENFILIYRGFYDSVNAKKGYQDLSKTLDKRKYQYLLEIVRIFKMDLYLDGVQIIINEVEKIIYSLPINILALLNLDLFKFVRNLILSL